MFHTKSQGEGDFRGTLGLAKDVPLSITNLRLRFDVDSDATDEQLAMLLKLTEHYCVIEADAAHAAAAFGHAAAQRCLIGPALT